MIYLDNNATTEPLPVVVDAVAQVLRENWGNPSSVHESGVRARHALEHAREQVARLVGCSARELILTSGGTESCNLALAGSLHAGDRQIIVTSHVEHSAVRECAASLQKFGAEVIWLPAGSDGLIDPQSLTDLLKARGSQVALVSIMWANNETGVVQPIEELSSICRRAEVRFHTDATQWVWRMPTNLQQIPVDLLTFSAHKMHGPKGTGALYCRRGLGLRPSIVGGPQERDRRGGTENVAGLVGFGIAAECAAEWLAASDTEVPRLESLRNRFESLICAGVPRAVVLGRDAGRIWSTSNISFPALGAEAVVVELSRRGVAASAGAACSSGSLEPSPVLLAMGFPPAIAHGAVRFSISRFSTESEMVEGAKHVIEAVEKLARSMV